MSIISNIKYSTLLLKSNFGREYGWILELNGHPVAELDDCHHDDMFWYSYRITCRSKDDQAIAFNPVHWEKNEFKFVNRITGDRVDQVIAGNAPDYITNGRVLLRGLSLTPRNRLEYMLVNIFRFFYRSKLY